MISNELERCLNVAIEEANRWGHEFVTIEHILFALFTDQRVCEIVKGCGGSAETTKQDLNEFFKTKLETSTIPKGGTARPTIGFQRVLQRAAQHVLASGKEKIYADSVLVSIFGEDQSFACYFLQKQKITRLDVLNFISHGVMKESDSSEFDGYEEEQHSHFHLSQTEGVPAKSNENPEGMGGQAGQEPLDAKNPLRLFADDLCEKARQGKIDPLVGRSLEVKRIVQILCRRKKNNPLLVGDAGVGKTAIIEGLARKIVEGGVPEPLQSSEVYSLDLGALISGTKFRGDFENRLKGLLKAIKKRPKAILFIDEIHTIIGAGSVSGGAMDASNILKPVLASGELRCIGSTTFKEYRQYFESDHAMARRFQSLNVDEPSMDETLEILKGVKRQYEEFHHVVYSPDALKASVELSNRYIKEKKLPDKAIDILDEVGAAIALKRGKKDKPHKIGVAEVKPIVAAMAKVPVEQLSQSQKLALQDLGSRLKGAVFGQDEAVTKLETTVRLAKAGLAGEDRPLGSFLFAGPTGVGKTELAKQLAKIMAIEFVRFDMSEYMERHSVSRLIGAPPGYVGHGEGGLLTDAVRKHPHAVLLLDEIEKAHSDVHNLLLQVMDHGSLTDANGRETDFRNLLIIMTTNVGASELSRNAIGFGGANGADTGRGKAAINQAFSPEFRNRLDAILSFNPLPKSVMEQIVRKFLAELDAKLAPKRVKLNVTHSAVTWLAEHGYDPLYGARPLRRLVEDKLSKPLAAELLFGHLTRGGRVSVGLTNDELALEYDS